MQCFLGVLTVCLDDPGTVQPFAHRPDEERGMRKCENRPVEAEFVVERGCENEHVGRQHAAGMIRHQQGATRRRDAIEAVYLRPEVLLDDRADPFLDLLGEGGIPLGGLVPTDGVNVLVAHSFPCVLLFEPHTQGGR